MTTVYMLRKGREVQTGSTVSGAFVLASVYEAMVQERDDLKSCLKRYGDHDQDCLAWNRDTRPCSCGYSTSSGLEKHEG